VSEDRDDDVGDEVDYDNDDDDNIDFEGSSSSSSSFYLSIYHISIHPSIYRTTFREWSSWCDEVFSSNSAAVLWDHFPPMACDIHAAAYSQVMMMMMLMMI